MGTLCAHLLLQFYIDFLNFYMCIGHGLKICMWFGYNPQIIFITFLQVELSHFSGIFTIKVKRKWVPCVRNHSNSFMPILLKLHRCFDHGLKTCMWFGYNPQIIFCHFFRNLKLVFLGTKCLITINICRQYVPCESNSSYKFKIFLAGDINSLNLLFCYAFTYDV